MIERYAPDAVPLGLQGKPFAAMDPGREGAVLAFDGNGTYRGWAPAIDPVEVSSLWRTAPWEVWTCETQFLPRADDPRVGSMARAAIEIGFTSGLTIGVVAIQSSSTISLVEVAPATWQAHQHRVTGEKRGPGSGIRVAMARAERHFPDRQAWTKETKAQRTGLAAAYGIAEWWVSTWRPRGTLRA